MIKKVNGLAVLTSLVFCAQVISAPIAGRIVAWGRNDDGQTNVPLGNDFIAVAGGNGFSIALHADGSLVAWGDNWAGQTNVPAGHDFVDVAAGDSYGLALKADGSVVEWGDTCCA